MAPEATILRRACGSIGGSTAKPIVTQLRQPLRWLPLYLTEAIRMFATPTSPQRAAVPGYPYRLPAETTFPALQNKNVLCILDYDNLRLSVLESQRRFSASLLIQRLTTECKSLEPW